MQVASKKQILVLLSRWQDDQHNTVVCRAPELGDLQQQIASFREEDSSTKTGSSTGNEPENRWVGS